MKLPVYLSIPPLTVGRPLVSVVMFCRNRVYCIRRAVESILSQTYTHWELVIQDGASHDGTREAIESYDDPRIKLVSEPDSGPFEAMWRAIRRMQGQILGFCLSDEELLPQALQEGVQYFRCHPEAAALGRDLYYTDITAVQRRRVNGSEFNFHDYLSQQSMMSLVTVLFRREALEAAGLFNRNWRTDCADFELISRIGERYRFDYYPGPSALFAQGHPGQLSTTPEVGFFCTKGHLTFISDFYQEQPQRGHLRNQATHNAFQPVKKLYREGGAHDLEDRLDRFYQTLKVAPPEPSLELAREALQIGKLDVAYRIFRNYPVTAPDYTEIQAIAAEVLERFCHPEQAAGLWSALAQKGWPQAAEKALIAQLKIPGTNPIKILADHKRWASVFNSRAPAPTAAPFIVSNSLRRLAFHASDWHRADLQQQLIPLLPLFNSDAFEIICYHGDRLPPTVFPENVQPVDVSNLSADEFRETVRAQKVDILIELSGLTPGNRLGALATRCARVQVSYLGLMATTGLRQIDFLVADPIICPPKLERLQTEKVLRLPNCYTCFSVSPASRPDKSLRLDDRFTFGCFSSPTLLNSDVLDCWARLLQTRPDARLLLAHPDYALSDSRVYIRSYYQRYELPPEQLFIVPHSLQGDPSILAGQVDLHLDTFPHSDSHAVILALAHGIPSVSLAGLTLAGRLGMSLLISAGLDRYVANTPEEYVAIAVLASKDLERLSDCRTTLPIRLNQGGPADLARFADNFQETLRGTL